jgi:hypothetical protein
MHNITLYFDVNFKKEDKLKGWLRFSKEIKMPFLPVKGQSYFLKYDPMTAGADFQEGHEYNVEESGFFETDEEIVPFFVLEDTETYEGWFESIYVFEENFSMHSAKDEWLNYIRKSMDILKENFLNNGWTQVED